MTQLTRRHFTALALALPVAACAPTGAVRLSPGSRLILLRHADRSGDQLSKDGIARARALPGALEGIEIDAIFSPSLERNIDTAQPLAKDRRLTIGRMPAAGMTPRLAAEAAGRSVVWVGNKGNLTEIWETLGAPGEPPLAYGDLFIIDAGPKGRLKVTRRHFGA